LELLAVVTILGIIAIVVIPRLQFSKTTAEINACHQNVAEINAAVERYNFENGSLPADIDTIGTDTDLFPDGLPVCPVDGSAYTLDATTKRVTGHVH
jgi:type II secretory pathway pseudopilin PulG